MAVCLDLWGAENIMAVILELPEDLERKARDAGLLTPEAMEAILRNSLRRASVRERLRLAKDIYRDPGPPMSLEEIQEEVDAVRAERHQEEVDAVRADRKRGRARRAG